MRWALVALLLVVLTFPAIAAAGFSDGGDPPIGGDGGGGQVCTWGLWVSYDQFVAPCGWNNWRQSNSAGYYTYGACYYTIWFQGASSFFDTRCGDANVFFNAGGGYSRPVLHNVVPYPIYMAGYVSTNP